MASSIVKQAIEEIKNLSKKTKTNQAIKDQTILLADIVGILHPVLARKGEVIDDAWRSVYANISVCSAQWSLWRCFNDCTD